MAVLKRAASKPSADDGFSLETVLKLGGNKDDFDLLQNVGEDDAEAIEAGGHDYDAEPIKRNEIKDFIASLGLGTAKNNSDLLQKKEKKVKLLTAPEFVDKIKGVEPVGSKKSKNKYSTLSPDTAAVDAAPSAVKTVVDNAFMASLVQAASSYKARPYALLKPGSWDEQVSNADVVAPSKAMLPASASATVRAFAKQLLEDDTKICQEAKDKQKQSDTMWMKRVLQSGTAADRTAALVTLAHDDPPHNVNALVALVAMVKKKGRRESMLAVDSVKELFLGLLPPSRRLNSFEQNAFERLDSLTGGNKDTRDRYLMLWYFECRLKEVYAEYVQALQALAHDVVLATKQKGLSVMYDLLVDKAELEKVLLSAIVNKLGDPERKMASKACHLLTQLVQKHQNMKAVVTSEIESMLFRPNIQRKSQYYGVCFLNQLVLSQTDQELAARMVKLYFTFFKASVKHGEVDSKMMSALLSGINRAFPYGKASIGEDSMQEQIDNLYKVLHSVTFGTSVQVLMLLYQVAGMSDTVTDRYYTALYRKLLDPELETSSKKAMFLNLIFKSLKKDLVEKRVKAFVKRLLQVTLHCTPPLVCAVLVLISEILKQKPNVVCRKLVAEVADTTDWGGDDDEEEHFKDVEADGEDGTVAMTKPSTSADLEKPLGNEAEERLREPGGVTANSHGSSWVHRRNVGSVASRVHYDAACRNPMYCRAELACEWELLALCHHYHPSVALFAQKLVQDQPVVYDGDPLQDFQLVRFLDRFVYRNPKKKPPTTEGSRPNVLQSRKQRYVAVGLKNVPVSSEEFVSTAEGDIPVDDKFFYRYFMKKAATKNPIADEMASDADSVSDDEFDEFLDTHEKGLDEGDVTDLGMDFASEFKKSQGKMPLGKHDDSEADEDDDDLDGLDVSDEDPDFGDELSFDELNDEDELAANESDIDDEDELEGGSDEEPKPGRTSSAPKTFSKGTFVKGAKRAAAGGVDTASLFASADAFSSLLDNEADGDASGSLHSLANTDKASAKQLQWEVDRDRWLHNDHQRGRKPMRKRKNSTQGGGGGKKPAKGQKQAKRRKSH